MDVIQTISGIALVFGLLALLYWMAYRLNGRTRTGGPRGRIEIVERLSLGDKKSLYLVRVGAETVLIGATPNTISVLTSVAAESEAAEDADEKETESTFGRVVPNFRTLLGMLR